MQVVISSIVTSMAGTDPIAMEHCKKLYPDINIEYKDSLEDMVEGLDALVLVKNPWW